MSSIIINTRQFNEVMQTASVMAGLHRGMMMLDNVLFQVKDGNLVVTSTDTEAYVSRSMGIESGNDVKDINVLVNPKDICQLLPLITDDTVTIEFEDNAMTLKHSKGFVSTATIDGAEFPTSPFEGGGNAYAGISSNALAEAMKKAVIFASNDTVRPNMCSVVLHFDDEGFNVYASDGVCLFLQEISETIKYDARDLLIPKKSVKAIVNMLKTCVAFKGILANDTLIKFVFEDGEVVTCLTDAKYPNVKQVIPQWSTKQIHVSKAALMESIKRVSLSAGDHRMIRLDLQSGYGTFDVSSADIDFGKKSKESVPAVINTDADLVIGLNADNLIKTMSSLQGDNLIVQMTESNKATLWSSSDDENTKIIVMPTKVE